MTEGKDVTGRFSNPTQRMEGTGRTGRTRRPGKRRKDEPASPTAGRDRTRILLMLALLAASLLVMVLVLRRRGGGETATTKVDYEAELRKIVLPQVPEFEGGSLQPELLSFGSRPTFASLAGDFFYVPPPEIPTVVEQPAESTNVASTDPTQPVKPLVGKDDELLAALGELEVGATVVSKIPNSPSSVCIYERRGNRRFPHLHNEGAELEIREGVRIRIAKILADHIIVSHGERAYMVPQKGEVTPVDAPQPPSGDG